MQVKNNIFWYSNKEFAQDAFLLYFFSFAKKGFASPDEDSAGELSSLAKQFLRKLWPTKFGSMSDEELNVTDTKKQYKKIDVLIQINNDCYIIIEDKIGTNVHNDQINVYAKRLNEEDKIPQENILCVFYKTIEQAFSEPEPIVNCTRQDILSILNQYKGSNLIVLNYRQYLQDMEDMTENWRRTAMNQWDSWSWRGFFRHITESGLMDYRSEKRLDGWKYIDNQNGGYYGICWKLWRDDDKIKLEKKGLIPMIGTLYLQLTSEKKVSIRVSCNIQNYSKSMGFIYNTTQYQHQGTVI